MRARSTLTRRSACPRCQLAPVPAVPTYSRFMRGIGHYHNRRGCPRSFRSPICPRRLGHAPLGSGLPFPAVRYFCTPLLCYRARDEAVASICVNARVMLRFIGTYSTSMNAPGTTDCPCVNQVARGDSRVFFFFFLSLCTARCF